MTKEQQNKKMTMDGLARLIKSESQKNQKELAGTVKIMLDAFQSNQEYMDKRFDNLAGEVRGGFKQVTEKINNLSRDAADVVRQEDFDKLETRMVVVEEAVVNLRLKKS